jgi:uncharacterized protein VirK/YbjX
MRQICYVRALPFFDHFESISQLVKALLFDICFLKYSHLLCAECKQASASLSRSDEINSFLEHAQNILLNKVALCHFADVDPKRRERVDEACEKLKYFGRFPGFEIWFHVLKHIKVVNSHNCSIIDLDFRISNQMSAESRNHHLRTYDAIVGI